MMQREHQRAIDHFNKVLSELSVAPASDPSQELLVRFDAAANDLLDTFGTEMVEQRLDVVRFVAQVYIQIGNKPRSVSWLERLRGEIRPERNIELLIWAETSAAKLYAETDRLDRSVEIIDGLLARSDLALPPVEEGLLLIYRASHRINQALLPESMADLDRAEVLLTAGSASSAGLEVVLALRAKALAMEGLVQEATILTSRLRFDNELIAPILDETRQYLGAMQDANRVPCVHRVLERALGNFAFVPGPHPRFVEPDVHKPNMRFRSSLTQQEHQECSDLAAEVRETPFDIGDKNLASASGGIPPAGTLGMKMHYVKDVANFKRIWNRFKLEESLKAASASLDSDFGKYSLPPISAGMTSIPFSKHQLVESANYLVMQAENAAAAGHIERFRSFSMFAANYLEIWTNDPTAAAFIWILRCRLLAATALIGAANQSECAWHFGWGVIRVHEIVRDLERAGTRTAEIFKMLSTCVRSGYRLLWSSRRDLWVIIDVLRELSEKARAENPDEFINLLFTRAYLLDRNGDIGHALALLDEALSLEYSLKTRISLDSALADEMLRRRGLLKLRTKANDPDSLERLLGPFAAFIAPEAEIDRSPSWREILPSGLRSEAAGRNLGDLSFGFADGSLFILKDVDEGPLSTTDIMLHEMQHAMRRSIGQMLRKPDGTWLRVKRDVPIASARSFLRIVGQDSLSDSRFRRILALAEWGSHLAGQDPDLASLQVGAMLAYYDDLKFIEADSSYPCGAILAGMAVAFCDGDKEVAASYLDSLGVFEHDEALSAARSGMTLSF